MESAVKFLQGLRGANLLNDDNNRNRQSMTTCAQ